MPSKKLSLLLCLTLFVGSSFSPLTQAEQPASATGTLSATPDGAFTIILIPDTQAYKPKPNGEPGELINPIFEAHTRWIASNIDRHQIKFVSHVGDIVDKNVHEQWKVARDCMDMLHGKVPYGISVGNHDMTSKGDSTLFQQYFPASRFQEFDWYGGTFTPADANTIVSANNANSYQLFSAAGMDFLFLHLECNAPDDVLAWANKVIEAHPERRVLVTSHMGLGPLHKPKEHTGYVEDPKGRMQWKKIHGDRGNTPQEMWEKCYSQHKNVFLVCCGDQSRSNALYLKSTGMHGNDIHECLTDYSTGWLRMYRFLPNENRIEAITFDPNDETLCQKSRHVDTPESHQFSFSYPMTTTNTKATK